jgi:hypothetical protein
MAGKPGKFGRKREDAIAALLTQRNVDEAAKAAGIGTRTLLRWMKEPDFDTSYREARRVAFRQSIARLQHASSTAVSLLQKAIVDSSAPYSTRVRAAEIVLSHTAKAIEIEDIDARVAALEAAKNQDPGSR